MAAESDDQKQVGYSVHTSQGNIVVVSRLYPVLVLGLAVLITVVLCVLLLVGYVPLDGPSRHPQHDHLVDVIGGVACGLMFAMGFFVLTAERLAAVTPLLPTRSSS